MTSFKTRDKIHRTSFIKYTMYIMYMMYTWQMVFVLSSLVHTASRMLCEPNDVGYNCDFSNSFQRTALCTRHIGLYITYYRESYWAVHLCASGVLVLSSMIMKYSPIGHFVFLYGNFIIPAYPWVIPHKTD